MNLKELRESKNLSQEDVAKAINTNQTSVSRWEKGKNEPILSAAIALAKYFDCTLDFLAGLTDEDGRPFPKDLPKKDVELLKAFHKLGPFEQETIMIQINALAEKVKI